MASLMFRSKADNHFYSETKKSGVVPGVVEG